MVLPQLFTDILPIGLAGVFLAALVAASNSTASSLLNSLATVAEHDCYRRFVPNKSAQHYTKVGRGVTVVAGMAAIIFALNVPNMGGIVDAIYKIMSFFEPPIFVIVAGALFWRGANAWGAGTAVVCGIGFSTYIQATSEMSDPDRTLWAFAVCTVALIVGSLAGKLLAPDSEERRRRIDALLERARAPKRAAAPSPLAYAGIGIALVGLAGFLGCAFHEEMLPKPANILIFMGLMMLFVWGCYLSTPVFISDVEPEEKEEAGTISSSWIHRIVGSGWAWLAVYALAGALVIALYFF